MRNYFKLKVHIIYVALDIVLLICGVNLSTPALAGYLKNMAYVMVNGKI